MQRLRIIQPQHFWLMGVVIVGLAIRLYIATRPVNILLLKTFPDDAFYYFVIARNIAEGYGVTADRLMPTNGFHPLWMLLITPLFMLFEGDQAVNASLVLASSLDIISMIMIYRVVRRLTGRVEPGALAALIYFLNPMVIFSVMNGLETAVNTAAISLAVDRFLMLRDKPEPETFDFVVVGMTLGVALLGRTDNVFLIVGCALTVLFWQRFSLGWRLRNLTVVSLTIALLTAPWFLWNLVTFGSVMQVSGVAFPYIVRTVFFEVTNVAPLSLDVFKHQLMLLSQAIRTSSIWAGFGRLTDWDGSILPVLLMLVTGISFVVLNLEVRQRTWNQTKRLAFLFGFVSLLLIYHSAFRWVYREWYSLPITWTLIVVTAIFYNNLVAFLTERTSQWRLYLPVLAVLAVALIGNWWLIWTIGIYPGQGGLITESALIDALPEGSLVGISDSGYVSYASERQVVNLDGVVNNEAAHAFMQGQLMDYLMDTEIDYLYVQPRYLIESLFGPDFPLYIRPEGIFYKVMYDEAERTAYFQIPDDGQIDVGADWAMKYLGNGWSRAEPPGAGVWADELEATLYLALPPGQSDQAHALRLYAMPFTHQSAPIQEVRVSVNDVAVDGTVTMELGAAHPYEVSIPPDVLHEGVNTVTFDFAYTISPFAIGHSSDRRTLAVWMDIVELQPENMPTTD